MKIIKDFESNKIRLKAVTLEDVGFLCAMANEPAVMEVFCDGPTSPENWRAMVTGWKADPDEENFIIVQESDGAELGWAKVHSENSTNLIPYR